MNEYKTDLLDLRRMDCMELMAQYPDKHFDLAIVDPPYGIGYSKLVGCKKESGGWKKRESKHWDNNVPDIEYFKELIRVSKNQIIWGGNYFSLPPTRCFLIWDKMQRIDQADCEQAWTSFASSARIFQYARGNESGFAPKLKGVEKAGANLHPCQKPVALYRWLLANYAKHGQTILDTHLGSASIAIACHYANHSLTACELDQDYFDASIERVKRETSQQTLNL